MYGWNRSHKHTRAHAQMHTRQSASVSLTVPCLCLSDFAVPLSLSLCLSLGVYGWNRSLWSIIDQPGTERTQQSLYLATHITVIPYRQRLVRPCR